MSLHWYTCDVCHRRLASENDEVEAVAEAERMFGHLPVGEERAEVCDDCWPAFKAWFDGLTPEDHREIKSSNPPTKGTP